MQDWRVGGSRPLSIMATMRSRFQDKYRNIIVIARETPHGSNCGNRHTQASSHDGEPCQSDKPDDMALPCIKERLTPKNICLTFPSHQIQSSQIIHTFLAPKRNQAEAASRRTPRQVESLKASALQDSRARHSPDNQSGDSSNHGRLLLQANEAGDAGSR